MCEGDFSMVCHTLRSFPWLRIVLTLSVFLALVGGIPLLPATDSEDGFPSLIRASHNLPLLALVGNSSVRIEKQAHTSRPLVKKPERDTRLALPGRSLGFRTWTASPNASAGLPRGHLHLARCQLSSADNSADPLSF